MCNQMSAVSTRFLGNWRSSATLDVLQPTSILFTNSPFPPIRHVRAFGDNVQFERIHLNARIGATHIMYV